MTSVNSYSADIASTGLYTSKGDEVLVDLDPVAKGLLTYADFEGYVA